MNKNLKQEITGAVARGWTHPQNEKKEMDTELAEAIVDEVYRAFISEEEIKIENLLN